MGINIDEGRAARREASKKLPDPITFAGEEFALPFELPLEAVHHMRALGKASAEKNGLAIVDSLEAAVRALLSPADFERFVALAPSYDDLAFIIESIPAEYGFADLGESSASPPQSKTTSARARRPAKPRTASTSPKPSTAKKTAASA